jgi:tetratricopeptide (TPR) repeat protein
MIGERLGAYRVAREIGSGGMGTVYAADVSEPVAGLDVGTHVALKVVHPHLLASADAVVRFRREVEIGVSVDHPNVVRTLDGGRSDGRYFLVMELVEGQTLAALQEELEHVPEELCRHIGREIAKGLDAIHAAGVVHRDVKPDNVLITPDHVVKIMDLGVARVLDEAIRLSQTGAFVGSLQYAAPECFDKNLGPEDHRVDLHALGLLLYELSTGDAPYAAPDLHGSIRRVLDDRPRRLGELNPQASPFFEDVVHTLLVKEPRGRFAAAADLLRVLEEGEKGTWWRARARSLRRETRRPLRRIRIPRETAIVGRDAELEVLRERYEMAATGEGQIVLIEGEAGIGKSRLVDELVMRLERSGEDVNFLFGGYPPGGAATASGAFSTAYREQFGEQGSAEYLQETPLLVPAFDALLRGDATPDGAQPLKKGSLQTCFVHATRALAAERPTIVLIDDLHFAPEDGRALFSALATALPGHRVLLVGTTRRGLEKEWLAGVTRHDHARHLELGRLGPKDLYALLLDALRSDRLANRLAGKIGLASDGNPFFVFEILRGLREGQLITRADDGSWVSTRQIDELEIPSTVRDLIEARVAELSDEERELLDVAACCGFEFDGSLVAAAIREKRIPVFRRLGRLEKKHRLVRASGRKHVFDHHQVREALYEGMSEVLREEYHAALADALEGSARPGETPVDAVAGSLCVELCEHFILGGRPESAAPYLSRATKHLAAGYLYDRAVVLADRLLAVPGLISGLERARLLRSKGYWLSHYGLADEERAALDEALAITEADGDLIERQKSYRSLGNHLSHVSDRDGALRHLRVALQLAEQAGDRAEEGVAANALATALYFESAFDEAKELLLRHETIASELGETRQLARAKSNLGLIYLAQSRYDEAAELFRATYDLATQIGDRYGQSLSMSNLGGIAYNRGRWEEAQEAFESDMRTSRELGDRRSEMVVTSNLGVLVRARGRYAEAENWHLRYLDLAEELGDRRAAGSARGLIGTLCVLVGDADAAGRWLHECLESSVALKDARSEAWAHRRFGQLHSLRGDRDAALEAYLRGGECARKLGVRGLLFECLSQSAATHMEAGDHDAARPLLEESAEIAERVGSPNWTTLNACRLARIGLGDSTTAVERLTEHSARMEVDLRLQARYLLWRLTEEETFLTGARSDLDHLTAHAPDRCRESMVENVPLLRAVRDGDAGAPVE